MLLPEPSRLSRRAARMRASEIRELLKLIDRPGMISFAGGIPDPGLFDAAGFAESFRRSLGTPAEAGRALQYSTSDGHLPLREWVAARMGARGVACTPEHILITHGSQQALDLIGKLYVDAGDTVLTEHPTYLGALQCFSAFEPLFAEIRFGGGTAVGTAPAARLIYLVPDFANPTGTTLSRAERQAALALAERLDAVVVEDAAYADLRLDGEPVPAIAALDQARAGSIEETRTLYCGTFSKALSPGLRVGWICGPAALIRRLTLIKQAADLHTATLNQIATHAVAAERFDELVVRARPVYRRRRDAMLAALERHAPEGVTWTRPEGGLFVWLTLPPGADAGAILRQALSSNVAFVPGAAFHPDGPHGGGSGRNSLRLSYSLGDEHRIEDGIERLCRLLPEALPAARVAVS